MEKNGQEKTTKNVSDLRRLARFYFSDDVPDHGTKDPKAQNPHMETRCREARWIGRRRWGKGAGERRRERQGRAARRREREVERCTGRERRGKRRTSIRWYVWLLLWLFLFGCSIGGRLALKHVFEAHKHEEEEHRPTPVENPRRAVREAGRRPPDKGVEMYRNSTLKEQHLAVRDFEKWKHERWKALHEYWARRKDQNVQKKRKVLFKRTTLMNKLIFPTKAPTKRPK